MPRRARRWNEHIEACPACREFAGGQQAVWQALDAWEPAAVSMDFDRRLYARIEQTGLLVDPSDPAAESAVPARAADCRSRRRGHLVAGLLMNRPAAIPVAPVEQSAQVETLQPDQVRARPRRHRNAARA